MSTELATYQPGGLTVTAEQTAFSDEQVKALAHIGVDKADEGDLKVFFHVCQRTGLDPFARQIHMIGRQVSEMGADGNWTKVTKQTIQTGIDGFRLIGRRAANQSGHKVSMSAAEWCHEDGSWRPAWRKVWGFPVAARVTITRDGEPFTAVAMFDEYVQTKRNGEPNSMWSQRPAGQLAKCAEALAWRMAFPQDLSGIYTDDELAHSSNAPAAAPRAEHVTDRLAELTAEPNVLEVADAEARIVEAEVVGSPLLKPSSALAKRLYATIGQAGIPEAQRIAFLAAAVGRGIESSKELTEDEAREVLDNFDALLADFMAGGAS